MADGIWEGSGPGRGGVGAAAQSRRVRAGLRITLRVAAAVVAALAVSPAQARQTQPTALSPIVLDGPSAPGAGPTALTSAIARDGTGALAYLKPVGGTPHVFVSALVGGAFQAPVQIDASLPGASARPLVAAGAGGGLVVAFLNGAGLYVAQRRGAGTGLGAPRLLAAGAANPALSMSPFGKTYLAFTVPGGSGDDVRVAFEAGGGWSIEGAPLNVNRGDDAGTGPGRPTVTAAGDGVGIVAWGEEGHVFSRRVWGTSVSALTEQADAPLPGCSETWADEPAIGAGGDSSYASLALHETLVCGGQTQSRVLVNRLHGSRYEGVWPADGPFGAQPGGSDHPAVAVGEYGSGWVTSEAAAGAVAAMPLTSNNVPGAGAQINAAPNAGRPYTTAAMAGLYATIVAWQHDPASGLAPDIRARYADSDQVFGPEMVLSPAANGPANAAAGLTAAGDVAGDAAVAWVQSTPAGDELIADQLYRAPSAPTPAPPPGYLHTAYPRVAWSPAFEPWGPVTYTLTLDGQPLGQTAALTWGLRTPVSQGPHTWRVVASNRAGLSSAPQSASFFVDTQPPAVSLILSLKGVAGRPLRLRVRATDHPAPLPAADASGVAAIIVRWGDGSVAVIGHSRTHVYRRPGRYRCSVIVLDRAGNQTIKAVVVRIVAPPKPKKPKGKGAPTGRGHA